MERRTTSSPQPWPQYEARTTFLRVPTVDWDAVRLGYKTEFRLGGGRNHATQVWNIRPPHPAVAYAVGRNGQHTDSSLVVIEATWREPLAAISDESLAREGFPDMAHFRRYWMTRTKKRFRPLTEVQVFRIRHFTAEDIEPLAVKILSHLYDGHLPHARGESEELS